MSGSQGFGAMASKVAAQASGAACNCARSAALQQQLAAEQKARAAENYAKDALLAAYQAELAAKEAALAAKESQLQELRRDRFGRKTEVIDVGSADGAQDTEPLPGEDDPDQPPSGAGRPEPPQEGQLLSARLFGRVGGGLVQSAWTADGLSFPINPQHRRSARRGLRCPARPATCGRSSQPLSFLQ